MICANVLFPFDLMGAESEDVNVTCTEGCSSESFICVWLYSRGSPTYDAPAMAGHTSEDVTYKALTSVGARIARVVDSAELPRLAELGAILEPVTASLAFAYHDRRSWVTGHASARMRLPCQWCEQWLDREVAAEFSAWLAVDEAQALEWDEQLASEAPIVVAGETLDIPLLIEDELIMAIPGRVCIDDQCVNRPLQEEKGEQPPFANSPFAVMAELIQKG
jgi:uncharacterized metal-binding protein YceD (DUF177 family)